MNTTRNILMTLAAALILSGCENDAASYRASDDSGVSLTLIREQRYFWDKTAAVALVVARVPECQRRHTLSPTAANDAEVRIFQAQAGSLLVRQDENWYLADAANCDLTAVEAPDSPPPAVGSFQRQGGRLRFAAHMPAN